MAKKSAPKVSPSQRKKWLELLQSAAANDEVGLSKSQYRVVLDSNIWISGLLYKGLPEAVIQNVLGNHKAILSAYIVDEVMAGLKERRPKLPQKWLKQLTLCLTEHTYDDQAEHQEIIRDIKDEPIIRLAIAQRSLIVTGDRDLLEHRGSSGVAILSVQEYLELFS